MQTITGSIKNLTFYNEESGFFVASITREAEPTVTVLGHASGMTSGLALSLDGEWERNKHGTQFKASAVRVTVPETRDGLIRFLSSGALPGVGEILATRMVEHFGNKVLEVLAMSPSRLTEVPKLGKKKAATIAAAWAERTDLHKDADALIFLRQHGLSTARAQKVNDYYKKRGQKTIVELTANPYDMTRLWGIGFSRADSFAVSAGVPPSSPFRMCAAIAHIVRTVQENGSCGVPVDDAIRAGVELTEQPENLMLDAIREEEAAKRLYREVSAGRECLFHHVIYKEENRIAARLAAILDTPPSRRVADASASLEATERALGLEWDDAQAAAVRSALENKVFVVTGGPGTGKTTVTRALIRSLTDSGMVVKHCAPTGKAADRAQTSTGFPSQTVHRLLEINNKGAFSRNAENPLELDALIVDEPSMVDTKLFLSILEAVPNTARVYLMGDADQLPSVGPGRVLKDLLDSKVIPCSRLTKIFRQAATSKIIRAATLFNAGVAPEVGWEEGSDFGFIDPAPNKRFNSPEEKSAYRQSILDSLLTHLGEAWLHGFDPLRDVQILSPMKMGILGTENLNKKIQDIMNPDGAEFSVGRKTFRVGDKIIQLANCYTKMVFNGEVGYIADIDPDSGEVSIDMPGRSVVYAQSELRDVDLGYAITIHKSQGSEFPAVYMLMDWSHFLMLKRNLGFTGMTRGQRLLLLFGNLSAVRKAAATPELDERFSRLVNLLPSALGPNLAEAIRVSNERRGLAAA